MEQAIMFLRKAQEYRGNARQSMLNAAAEAMVKAHTLSAGERLLIEYNMGEWEAQD